MSDLPLKLTLKSGSDYSAPWLTVDAADPDDLTFKLDAILGGESLQKVVEVAALFQAARNVEPGPQQQAAPAQTQQPAQSGGWGQRPQQQQAAPAPTQQGGAQFHPEGKACRCGNVLNFKQVNRRSDGKQFSFWECPARTGSKDTQHDSEFAN